MAARGPGARKAAAQALTDGKPGSRGTMRVYYGSTGAAANRFSERDIQLSVRQRLAHIVRHLLHGKDWRQLPRGQLDLRILRGRGLRAHGGVKGKGQIPTKPEFQIRWGGGLSAVVYSYLLRNSG